MELTSKCRETYVDVSIKVERAEIACPVYKSEAKAALKELLALCLDLGNCTGMSDMETIAWLASEGLTVAEIEELRESLATEIGQ